ncbi:Ribosomal large subunit pseudouridine synthase B [Chlamydiales bacterium STE3]|nr:Ribosomal large subunit pseudouridine synthase B [Chlamydiales bacterium STE3]
MKNLIKFLMKKQRLSKILAASGVASRRKCEELIFSGKVKVNGEIALLPQTMVDIDSDEISVGKEMISKIERKVYFLLNKPAGYVCSNNPGPTSKNVLTLFGNIAERLFTVGRLDRETQGLLLITNDGHFANKVIHPSSNISKEYLAKTDKEITHEHLVAISSGTIVEGVFVKPLKVSKVRRGTVKITIAEGKKREVRILLESVGLDVKELTRIRIGGLQLGKLSLGDYRALTPRDIDLIFEKNS